MRGRQRLAFDSSAPEDWLVGASSAARLYRRLLAAVDAANLEVAKAARTDVSVDVLVETASELRRQAIAITEHLVVVSRLPFAKRQIAFVPLRSQVDEVERLSSRIGLSAVEARGHGNADEGLKEVAAKLQSLDAARSDAELQLPERERASLRSRLGGVRESSEAWFRSHTSGGDQL